MKIELTHTAEKQLARPPRSEAKKIIRKISQLEPSPYIGKKLKGELKDKFSLKAWPYRIIYVVSSKKELVQIEVIEHRQGVYK